MLIDRTKEYLPDSIRDKLLRIHKFLYDINEFDFCKRLESIAYLFQALEDKTSREYLILSYKGTRVSSPGESYLSMNDTLKKELVNSIVDNFNNTVIMIKGQLSEVLQSVFPG